MPIQRFGSTLVSKGQFQGYMAMLRGAYNPQTLASVMCRTLVSVDWRGYLYDCDFNQMLGLSLGASVKPRVHIKDLAANDIEGQSITVRDHCYGCTAGQGSSCGGALTAEGAAV
jgi:radical SAM/Cys-rich protein